MEKEHAITGVKEGDLLAGKYRIDKVLGVGGMGVVVAAHHIHLDEPVAIKFMLPHALSNKEAVNRFAREARAAVKIKSEHVARVSDVGMLENGAPYMVMEYLEGRDLSAWLKESGPLPIEQAVEFVLQACEALAEAHALGIVHRDLKPANLFVVRAPGGHLSVKVLDFGISKVVSLPGANPDSGLSMTKTSAMMGSPLYMSPEQMQSPKDVDERSDIWALGVTLYELLTSSVPFLAESLPEVMVRTLKSAPDPIRAHRLDIPTELERIMLRCLEKDREQRYPTAGALASDLVPFGPKRSRVSLERISAIMHDRGLPASELPPLARSKQAALASPDTSSGQTARTARGLKVFLLAGGALGATLLIVAQWWKSSASSRVVQAEAPSSGLAPLGPPSPSFPNHSVQQPPAASTPPPDRVEPVALLPSAHSGVESAARPMPNKRPRSTDRLTSQAASAAASTPTALPPAKKGTIFDYR